MAGDAAPWSLWTQQTIVVAGEAVPEEPSRELPRLVTLGKVTITAQTYQLLAQWIVPTGKVGFLWSAELYSSDYTHTLFQIVLAAVIEATDLELPTTWSGNFGGATVLAGRHCTLQAKSTDGTSIDVWGTLEGKEVG